MSQQPRARSRSHQSVPPGSRYRTQTPSGHHISGRAPLAERVTMPAQFAPIVFRQVRSVLHLCKHGAWPMRGHARGRPLHAPKLLSEVAPVLPATKASRHPARTMLSKTLHAIVTTSSSPVYETLSVSILGEQFGVLEQLVPLRRLDVRTFSGTHQDILGEQDAVKVEVRNQAAGGHRRAHGRRWCWNIAHCFVLSYSPTSWETRASSRSALRAIRWRLRRYASAFAWRFQR
jgi:hypothetical protein